MKRLQTKVSALAARINQDFGQNFLTPGRAFTDHVASLNDPQASKDVTIIVRNAWILALQAGDKGINGADAFRTGVSPRALAMFKADLPQSHYACARTGVEFNWLAGNGSSRVSANLPIHSMIGILLT